MYVSSPLILVYQTLGSVRASQISENLQSALDKQLPDSGLKANSFKIKNTIATATKDLPLAQFLQANNILVGWQVEQASILDNLVAKKSNTLKQILSSSDAQPPKLPQKSISAAIDISLKLSEKQPVALLASFYGGSPIKLKHMKEWMGLDELTVYSELIGQIEGVPMGLLELDHGAEQLVSTLDAAGPQEMLMHLDMQAAASESASGTPA